MGSISKFLGENMNSNIYKVISDKLTIISSVDIRNKIQNELQHLLELKNLDELTVEELFSKLKLSLSIAQNNLDVRYVCEAVVTHFIESNPSQAATAQGALDKYFAGACVDNAKNPKKNIVRPSPISGFLEFMPEIQLHYDGLLNELKKLFSSHGFIPIDTPVVERLEVLAAKGGDVDKEIYAVTRARAKDDDNSDASVALRYDLTVPLARYVAQHFNNIFFPFKRFHIGSCFRGERPQDGRYRQFTQADIDIINPDNVSLSFDADIPLIVNAALQIIGIKNYVFRISNRKILSGYLEGLDIKDLQTATRILDKIDKIGQYGVIAALQEELQLDTKKAEQVVQIASISCTDLSFVDQVLALGVTNNTLEIGLEELKYVMERLQASTHSNEKFVVDLSITRGFDYYTGTVYEVKWKDYPHLGSIAAGGRYEDLAGSYIRKSLPGVGMSVGLSRIYGKLVQTGAIEVVKKSPTDVLVVWEEAIDEKLLHVLGEKLRARNINTEVYFKPEKIQKQLNYANKKAIRYVVFPSLNEVKDLESEEQYAFDIETFKLQG
ncbi:histidine--tRNA ligase [Photorhabdus temperata subsp. temperata]